MPFEPFVISSESSTVLAIRTIKTNVKSKLQGYSNLLEVTQKLVSKKYDYALEEKRSKCCWYRD